MISMGQEIDKEQEISYTQKCINDLKSYVLNLKNPHKIINKLKAREK